MIWRECVKTGTLSLYNKVRLRSQDFVLPKIYVTFGLSFKVCLKRGRFFQMCLVYRITIENIILI